MKQLAILLLLAQSAWATTYYLDSSVGASGNGLAWGTAWKNVANMTGLVAGDVVNISGGPSGSSQTYPITGSWPAFSGTSGNPITYQIGQDAAHNGTAFFSGSGFFMVGPLSDVVLSGDAGDGGMHFSWANPANNTSPWSAIVWAPNSNFSRVRLSYINGGIWPNVISGDNEVYQIHFGGGGHEFDHCYLYCTSTTVGIIFHIFGFGGAAFDSGMKFHHNKIFGPHSANGWDDFLGTDIIQHGVSGLSVYNNEFYGVPDSNAANHQDGVQGWASYLKVYNNYFFALCNSGLFNCPIGASSDLSHIWIYNNVCVQCGESLTIYNNNNDNTTRTFTGIIICNNTIVDAKNYPYFSPTTAGTSTHNWVNCYMANNALLNNGGGVISASINQFGNIVGNPSSFVKYVDSRGVNPLTNNYDLHLRSTDTLFRGQGQALTQFFTTDKDGNPRPASGAWDVGAYQFGAATPATNPVIAVSPASGINFGVTYTNTPLTNNLFVTNIGPGTLAGTGTVSAPFSFPGGSTYSFASNVGNVFPVKYNPTAPGATNLSAAFTGGGGQSVNLSGVACVVQPALSFAATAGTLISPFVSSGGRVQQNSATFSGGIPAGGVAVYGFNIASAGTYFVTNNVLATNDSYNSVYWNMDAYPTNDYQIWDVPLNASAVDRRMGWRGGGYSDSNQFLSVPFVLTAGNHYLVVVGREAYTSLGQFSIGQDSTNAPVPPVVAFTNSNPVGSAPLTVFFTNLTTGATNSQWNFGDGGTSSLTNPSHIFQSPSTYSVTLTATGPGGTASYFADSLVQVTNAPNPVAAFSAGPTSGSAPLAVNFTNTSTGASSYVFSFGDGTVSNLVSTSPFNHVYVKAGTNTISLTASQFGSNNTVTVSNMITVTNLPLPVAAFTANITNGSAPLAVQFTNLSVGWSYSLWSLGDGQTNSYVSGGFGDAPTHVYTTGVYTVRLTVTNAGGTNSLSRTNYIRATNGPPIITIRTNLPFWIRIFPQ